MQIDGIQNILARIKEIESISSSFEKNLQGDLQQKTTETPFAKELQKQIEKPKAIEEEIQPIKVMAHSFKKPTSINEIILAESKVNGLDPDLVKAVIKAESNFNPKATSPKGAKGLMQLMPSTAELLGVENAYDPSQNIKGGAKYLKDMMKTFKKKDLAIAAYNAGPGAVKKYNGIPPYAETKNYVKKVNEYINELR